MVTDVNISFPWRWWGSVTLNSLNTLGLMSDVVVALTGICHGWGRTGYFSKIAIGARSLNCSKVPTHQSNLPQMGTWGRATLKLPSSLSWWHSSHLFSHPSLGVFELSPLHFNSTELKLASMFKGYMIRSLQKDKAGLHKACFLWKARQAPKLEWLTSIGNLTPSLSFSWSRFVHSHPTRNSGRTSHT